MPLAVVVEGANRHDMKLAAATLGSLKVARPQPTAQSPQGLCLDRGYDFEEVRRLVAALGMTLHVPGRGEKARQVQDVREEREEQEEQEVREPGGQARRWVVERTHGWLNRFRGLLIRWNKKAANYLALLHLACGIIAWRATGLMG